MSDPDNPDIYFSEPDPVGAELAAVDAAVDVDEMVDTIELKNLAKKESGDYDLPRESMAQGCSAEQPSCAGERPMVQRPPEENDSPAVERPTVQRPAEVSVPTKRTCCNPKASSIVTGIVCALIVGGGIGALIHYVVDDSGK